MHDATQAAADRFQELVDEHQRELASCFSVQSVTVDVRRTVNDVRIASFGSVPAQQPVFDVDPWCVLRDGRYYAYAEPEEIARAKPSTNQDAGPRDKKVWVWLRFTYRAEQPIDEEALGEYFCFLGGWNLEDLEVRAEGARAGPHLHVSSLAPNATRCRALERRLGVFDDPRGLHFVLSDGLRVRSLRAESGVLTLEYSTLNRPGGAPVLLYLAMIAPRHECKSVLAHWSAWGPQSSFRSAPRGVSERATLMELERQRSPSLTDFVDAYQSIRRGDIVVSTDKTSADGARSSGHYMCRDMVHRYRWQLYRGVPPGRSRLLAEGYDESLQLCFDDRMLTVDLPRGSTSDERRRIASRFLGEVAPDAERFPRDAAPASATDRDMVERMLIAQAPLWLVHYADGELLCVPTGSGFAALNDERLLQPSRAHDKGRKLTVEVMKAAAHFILLARDDRGAAVFTMWFDDNMGTIDHVEWASGAGHWRGRALGRYEVSALRKGIHVNLEDRCRNGRIRVKDGGAVYRVSETDPDASYVVDKITGERR